MPRRRAFQLTHTHMHMHWTGTHARNTHAHTRRHKIQVHAQHSHARATHPHIYARMQHSNTYQDAHKHTHALSKDCNHSHVTVISTCVCLLTKTLISILDLIKESLVSETTNDKFSITVFNAIRNCTELPYLSPAPKKYSLLLFEIIHSSTYYCLPHIMRSVLCNFQMFSIYPEYIMFMMSCNELLRIKVKSNCCYVMNELVFILLIKSGRTTITMALRKVAV